jgi:hypothetical protein
MNEAVLLTNKQDRITAPFRSPMSYIQAARKFGIHKLYFRYQYVRDHLGDPLNLLQGTYYGPSLGLRIDFAEYAALKLQYNYLYQHAYGGKWVERAGRFHFVKRLLNLREGDRTDMAKHSLHIAMLLLIFCGCAHAQCLPGGLAVIANKANLVENLSMAQLRKLILGDVRGWLNNKNVALIARDPSSEDNQCMLSSIVHLSVAEYHRYITSAEFRGDDAMVIQTVDSDATAGKYVSGSAGGLAVIEANSLPAMGASVKVIHIEGKTLGQPSHPL